MGAIEGDGEKGGGRRGINELRSPPLDYSLGVNLPKANNTGITIERVISHLFIRTIT